MNDEKKFTVAEMKEKYTSLQKEFEEYSRMSRVRAEGLALKALLIKHYVIDKDNHTLNPKLPDYETSALYEAGQADAYQRCAQRCKDMAQYTN